MHAASRAFFETGRELPAPPESELLHLEEGVGVIEIHGAIMRNPDLLSRILFGAVDTEDLIAAVHEAGAREDVDAVLLDVDSPGGAVSGTPELAQAVADLSRTKAVYAFTGGQMHSAAYWVASQAHAIYATPSARVGSIGVILPLVDDSEAFKREGFKVEVFAAGKFKSIGTPGTSLTDEQRDLIQSQIQEIADEFHSAVLARGRRIPTEAMQGQTFSARQAQRLNLAGMVKDRDEAMRRLRTYHTTTKTTASAVDTGTGGEMKTLDQELEEARQRIAQMETAHSQALDSEAAKIAKLEGDAQAREALLTEAATKSELLEGQLAEAAANRERLDADLSTARQTIESLNSTNAEIEARATSLAARNAELEALEKDLEIRASKRAAEIVASTGTTAPVPVSPKGDSQGEDLVARFKAITDPKEQTTFWRSLTAQQQALILSSSSNQ